MRTISLYSLLGALYATAFAPLNAYWIAWPALGIFYWHFKQLNYSLSCKYGFCFALGFNAVAHSWIYNSIATYGDLNMPFSILVTLSFLSFLSICQAVLLSLFHLSTFEKVRQRYPALLFTLCWITFEWLKSTPLICFPWSQLSYAVVDTPFAPLLPVTGILGTSTVLVAWICLNTHALMQRRIPTIALSCVALIITCCLASRIEWITPVGQPLRFAAIQGNITEFEKWDPNNLPKILTHYGHTSLKYLERDFIIWPEGAIPMPWQHIRQTLEPIGDVIKSNNASVLIGTSEIAPNDLLHNSMVILSPDHDTQYYRKENLVYFGEILPLRRFVQPIIDALQLPLPMIFTYPTKPNPLPYIRDNAFAPLICFDVAFHHTIAQFMPKARFLITISDDAWFGHSFALAQHLQIAAAQARVFARPHIIATNSGLTAQIEPNGEITKSLTPFTQQELLGDIQGVQGSTLASQIKPEWVLLTLIISIAALLFF